VTMKLNFTLQKANDIRGISFRLLCSSAHGHGYVPGGWPLGNWVTEIPLVHSRKMTTTGISNPQSSSNISKMTN
jgi:hypothetical protein